MTPTELRAALDTLGWSGRHLAKLLACDPAYPSDWTCGKTPVPPAVTAWLQRLVAAHARHPAPSRETWQARRRAGATGAGGKNAARTR